MKVIIMHVDNRPLKKKIIAYGKPVLKAAALIALLVINTEAAGEAFKLGNIVDAVHGIPNAIH